MTATVKVGTTGWTTSDKLTWIHWDGEAISAVALDRGWTVVRPTTTGEFAVILVSGSKVKVAKVLPTDGRARAYSFAVAK